MAGGGWRDTKKVGGMRGGSLSSVTKEGAGEGGDSPLGGQEGPCHSRHPGPAPVSCLHPPASLLCPSLPTALSGTDPAPGPHTPTPSVPSSRCRPGGGPWAWSLCSPLAHLRVNDLTWDVGQRACVPRVAPKGHVAVCSSGGGRDKAAIFPVGTEPEGAEGQPQSRPGRCLRLPSARSREHGGRGQLHNSPALLLVRPPLPPVGPAWRPSPSPTSQPSLWFPRRPRPAGG